MRNPTLQQYLVKPGGHILGDLGESYRKLQQSLLTDQPNGGGGGGVSSYFYSLQ